MSTKFKKPTKKQLDREIEAAYGKIAEGCQIDVMKIGKVFAAAHALIASGVPVDRATADAAVRFVDRPDMIASRFANSLGHIPLRCDSYECPRCGASGAADTGGMRGSIFASRCGEIASIYSTEIDALLLSTRSAS